MKFLRDLIANFLLKKETYIRSMSHHLIDIVQRLGRPKILVLGDLILDRYVWGDAERISQEAPVILLREDRREIRLGGAANVANMLRGLDAEVTLAGVIGSDSEGRELQTALSETGINNEAILVDNNRPTTAKQRLIGRAQNRHPHQMMRIDRESRIPLDAALSQQLIGRLASLISEHKAVLISDYAKGVCTPEILQAIIDLARAAGIPAIVDPGPGVDYADYRNATALTPNRLETKLATGLEIKTPEDAFAAGEVLCSRVNLDHVFVTLDSDGIALVRSDGHTELLPTRRREVYDITGAGDMVLAMIGVGAAEGIAPADLARLANVAGGLEVEQIGVAAITRDQILADLLTGTHRTDEKVCHIEELVRHATVRRKLGQKIVFTNGCFDMLHLGHVTYLQQAAREGDCLIVAVNSDSSVRQLGKAPDRPIFDQKTRAAMLAALEAVDYVIVFDESTPHALLERLKPDLLVKGGTYSREEIVGWELVEAYGGKVKPLGALPGLSTTKILERLRAGTVSDQPCADQAPTMLRIHKQTRETRKAGLG